MGKSFWDRIAFLYDLSESLNGKAYRAMLERTAAMVPPGGSVLDCAAGTGELALAMAGRAERVLCTDLSLSMLERARRKAAKRGISNLDFALRDLTALPDPDGAYDAAAAGNVLHLLEDPGRAVKELLRVTRPGGPVILPTFLLAEKTGLEAALVLYRLLGFRPAVSFDRESYRAFLAGCGAPLIAYEFIPGHFPVGLGVLEQSA